MKKTLIIVAISIAATAAVWAVCYRGQNDLSKFIPAEEAVPEKDQASLEPVKKALIDLCVRGQWKTLEAAFKLTADERAMEKEETGEDPVESYLALLKEYAPRMKKAKWEMFRLVKSPSTILFRIKDGEDCKLQISLLKQQGKYMFTSVNEIQGRKK